MATYGWTHENRRRPERSELLDDRSLARQASLQNDRILLISSTALRSSCKWIVLTVRHPPAERVSLMSWAASKVVGPWSRRRALRALIHASELSATIRGILLADVLADLRQVLSALIGTRSRRSGVGWPTKQTKPSLITLPIQALES